MIPTSLLVPRSVSRIVLEAGGGLFTVSSHLRARMPHPMVRTVGTSNVSHIGAVAQWVKASAQVLTNSTKYISGSCRDNAMY